MKLSMEDLVEFLQVSLSKDFFFDDDFVIEQLQNNMSELRRSKLELTPAGNVHVYIAYMHIYITHTHTHTQINSNTLFEGCLHRRIITHV